MWRSPVIAFALLISSLSGQNARSREVGKTIWLGQVVDHTVNDGQAVISHDLSINLPAPAIDRESARSAEPRSTVLPWVHPTLWPSGIIPYEVDPAIPNPQRVLDGIAEWNTRTPVRLVPHTNESTYLRFVRNTVLGACFTNLTVAGGLQLIQTLDSCDAGTIAHEIGHVAGLAHEHQRADRDYYIRIAEPNVEKIRVIGEALATGGQIGVGAYDYGSLMHYGRYFDLKNPKLSTIETIPPGIVIGAFHHLSEGDVDTITRMYGAPPAKTTVSTNPPRLQVVVDGVAITAPQSFDWMSGSKHTVEIADPQSISGEANTRYLFGRWSDNQPQSHTITASSDITVFIASFIRQYKLETGVTPAGSGSVTVSPASADGFYTDNQFVTLTATPSPGYRFLVWGPSGILQAYHGYSNSPVTFPMKLPLTYSATFTTADAYTIATDPTDINVIVDGFTPAAPRRFNWLLGSTHTIGATETIYNQWSTIRHVFTGWSDLGAATHAVTVTSLPQTVTASYKVQYKLTTQVSGTGRVTVSPESPDGFYEAGTTVQITATPGTDFQFTGWSGDLTGAPATQSLTMTDEMVVTATFQRPFTISATGIVNSASYEIKPVSPGEITVIFGLAIGSKDLTGLQLDSSGNVATSLAGTRVLFDGVAGPIVYTSANQIAAVVPYAVAGRTSTSIQVELNGQKTNIVSLPVGASAPGIYTLAGNGLQGAAALNEDGSVNTPDNPAAKGSIVVLFVTGEGQSNPNGIDGKPATNPLPRPQLPVRVRLAGPAGITLTGDDILYAGGAPSETAGVMQVNARIPLNAPTGNVPIAVLVGDQASPEWVTIAIR